MVDFESLRQLRDWKIVNNHHLEKKLSFPNFVDGLAFVNEVGRLAEEEQHHPEIFLTWGKVRIVCYSHDINGLSERDIELASKISGLTTGYRATA